MRSFCRLSYDGLWRLKYRFINNRGTNGTCFTKRQFRGFSIPGFLWGQGSFYPKLLSKLKEGYVFTAGNSQIQSFRSFENSYEARYPIGWNTEKAFSYLRKEID
jgi:hypothetical protein